LSGASTSRRLKPPRSPSPPRGCPPSRHPSAPHQRFPPLTKSRSPPPSRSGWTCSRTRSWPWCCGRRPMSNASTRRVVVVHPDQLTLFGAVQSSAHLVPPVSSGATHGTSLTPLAGIRSPDLRHEHPSTNPSATPGARAADCETQPAPLTADPAPRPPLRPRTTARTDRRSRSTRESRPARRTRRCGITWHAPAGEHRVVAALEFLVPDQLGGSY
jgi:hypothetical protein